MQNKPGINWKSFKETLYRFPKLDLQFQYTEGKWVDTSYHITEIKQAPITSVDCGGIKNRWTEIIIQLWEPVERQQFRSMKVEKALSIIEIVEKILPLDPQAIVKIEFGNDKFDTCQMYPEKISADMGNLVVDLRPGITQCKAVNRGESCGIPENTKGNSDKSKIKLQNLAESYSRCTPGSGCC